MTINDQTMLKAFSTIQTKILEMTSILSDGGARFNSHIATELKQFAESVYSEEDIEDPVLYEANNEIGRVIQFVKMIENDNYVIDFEQHYYYAMPYLVTWESYWQFFRQRCQGNNKLQIVYLHNDVRAMFRFAFLHPVENKPLTVYAPYRESFAILANPGRLKIIVMNPNDDYGIVVEFPLTDKKVSMYSLRAENGSPKMELNPYF